MNFAYDLSQQSQEEDTSVTPSAIARLLAEGSPDLHEPCLRVEAVAWNDKERLTLTLGDDGADRITGKVAAALNASLRGVAPGAVVRLTKCLLNTIRGERVLIVLDLDVVAAAGPAAAARPPEGGGAPSRAPCGAITNDADELKRRIEENRAAALARREAAAKRQRRSPPRGPPPTGPRPARPSPPWPPVPASEAKARPSPRPVPAAAPPPRPASTAAPSPRPVPAAAPSPRPAPAAAPPAPRRRLGLLRGEEVDRALALERGAVMEIHGGAGAGKSILAYTLVAHALARGPPGAKVLVVETKGRRAARASLAFLAARPGARRRDAARDLLVSSCHDAPSLQKTLSVDAKKICAAHAVSLLVVDAVADVVRALAPKDRRAALDEALNAVADLARTHGVPAVLTNHVSADFSKGANPNAVVAADDAAFAKAASRRLRLTKSPATGQRTATLVTAAPDDFGERPSAAFRITATGVESADGPDDWLSHPA